MFHLTFDKTALSRLSDELTAPTRDILAGISEIKVKLAESAKTIILLYPLFYQSALSQPHQNRGQPPSLQIASQPGSENIQAMPPVLQYSY